MLAVAVLAAGKGTRMKSALPKVLQPLAGATLVERVLASARNLAPERRLLIVGHQAKRVEEQLSSNGGLEFVLQQPQNGTGHAVQQLLDSMPSAILWLLQHKFQAAIGAELLFHTLRLMANDQQPALWRKVPGTGEHAFHQSGPC